MRALACYDESLADGWGARDSRVKVELTPWNGLDPRIIADPALRQVLSVLFDNSVEAGARRVARARGGGVKQRWPHVLLACSAELCVGGARRARGRGQRQWRLPAKAAARHRGERRARRSTGSTACLQ